MIQILLFHWHILTDLGEDLSLVNQPHLNFCCPSWHILTDLGEDLSLVNQPHLNFCCPSWHEKIIIELFI